MSQKSQRKTNGLLNSGGSPNGCQEEKPCIPRVLCVLCGLCGLNYGFGVNGCQSAGAQPAGAPEMALEMALFIFRNLPYAWQINKEIRAAASSPKSNRLHFKDSA